MACETYEKAFSDTVNPNASAVASPSSKDLDKPIDGVYVRNLHASLAIYVALDTDATGKPGDIQVPAGEWLDIGLRAKKYVSFWASGNVTANIVGYRKCVP